MNLRDHPLVSYRRHHSWPPVWSWIGGQREKTIAGETGVLKEVRQHEGDLTKCYLVMDHDDSLYMGCLMISDVAFACQMFQLLKKSRGKSIQEIGALDLAYTL
ncbi:MAG TPA: hypothetical protein VGA73_08580 [Candidatus Binatia bacterium]